MVIAATVVSSLRSRAKTLGCGVLALKLILSMKQAVSAADIGIRVEIREGDVIKLMNGIHDQGAGVLSLQNDATSVFLYLLPNGLETIKPFLES